MRVRWIPLLFVTSLLTVRIAHASGGYAPPAPPAAKPDQPKDASRPAEMGANHDLSAREQAEKLYSEAFDNVTDGKKDLDKGKAKSAQKTFTEALGQLRQVVTLDSTYAEAWNLIGYTARMTGKMDAAFAAYDRCLALKPDMEIAHEYRGEGYLQLGKPDKAHEELAWLEKRGSEYRKELSAAITEWEKNMAAKPAADSTQAR